ncbi:MAG: hypothetical protein LBL32_00245 [Holosporales bacterium]|jgi:diaminopimelate epimerase|nr:hypothetical protein [Holosporales bacterium]
MHFVKAQTNGNDFVIILRREDDPVVSSEMAKAIADRHFGIGCDQVIILKKITDMMYNIDFFNFDGSPAKMCGNGICASSIYISKTLLSNDSSKLSFMVADHKYMAIVENEEVTLFVEKPILLYDTQEYQIFSLGNNHLVCGIQIMNRLADLSCEFRECNLHFVEYFDEFIKVKTFERGVGWTKACGSGAIAVAATRNISGSTKIIHDGGMSIVTDHGNTFSLTVKPTLVFNVNFYND